MTVTIWEIACIRLCA